VDDPFAGGERQHKSWRDLPPTPPLVWPTAPAYATAAGTIAQSGASTSRRPRRGLVVGTGLLLGAFVLVGTGLLTVGDDLSALLRPLAAAADPDAPGNDPDAGNGGAGVPSDEPLAETASKILPSVVQIEAGGAMGSGFVAAEGGLILTASHVVGRSETVTLRLHDGSSISGTVVATDRSIDTAVIRAEQDDLPALELGALQDVQVGEMTIAVGSPFGFSQTVTTGIVSALGRTVPTPMGELHDLIQTDAAINSGNSGGPLADREGRAIGINTAIASASGGSDGIGFAVPVDQARSILDKVVDGSWDPADNDPADGMDPLGGLFDQFFGPDGMDGLEDLFGRGLEDLFGLDPNAPQGPQGPNGGTDPMDQLMQRLLDELFRGLVPTPEEEPAPAPDPTPAPDSDDQTGDALDQLMEGLLDELLGGLDPNSLLDPFAPDAGSGDQGATTP
jgi:S1-C subfamily serine protease